MGVSFDAKHLDLGMGPERKSAFPVSAIDKSSENSAVEASQGRVEKSAKGQRVVRQASVSPVLPPDVQEQRNLGKGRHITKTSDLKSNVRIDKTPHWESGGRR